ncbi:MAG: DUF4434 domain-containing protein, partial [Clostridia bacterium]
MKKKIITSIILILVITFILSSCHIEKKEEKDNTTQMTQIIPIVTGSFIQPDLCRNWTVDDFKKHFAKFKELSMDTFILQWIATTPYGKIDTIYYDTKIAKEHFTEKPKVYPTMVENCLAAAQECGIKVFIGINLSNEWWSYPLEKDNWLEKQTDISKLIATELFDLYKQKYPQAFYGWYWAWEMSNGMNSNELKYAQMLNLDLKTFNSLDKTMPLLMSPFNTFNSSAEKAYEEWSKFFSATNFRKGDIFCCQDAVGAAWITIDKLDDYYAIKKAVDEKGGLRFWANSENFVSDFTPSTLDRFYDQLQIAKKYCEKIISFSFCHYYFNENKPQGFINGYKEYFKTLKKDITPPKECN